MEKRRGKSEKISSGNNTNSSSSSSSGSSSSSSDDGEVYVPDGGWGWMVCLGSFLVNFILDGTMFSFGVLLLELLAYFGEGKAKTSMIGSSLLGMSMFMETAAEEVEKGVCNTVMKTCPGARIGPIVSILLERFSCRQITVTGTILSVVAFVISTFSPNVEILIITYGIIGGIGFCMSFVSAIIVVGLYFKRKRAIATGLAMSGSGLGTFTYAYLSNYLISLYDWRGTILILSGILLNGVICGLLFRPLPLRKRADSEPDVSQVRGLEEAEKLLESNKINLLNRVEALRTSDAPYRLTVSTDLMDAQKEHGAIAREFKSHYDIRDLRFRHAQHTDDVMQNPMKRKDIFYSGSLARLPSYSSSTSWTDEETGSSTGISDVSSPAEDRCESSGFRALVSSRLRLFNDKIFVLLLFTNVFWTVQSVPLTFIPDLAVSKSIPTSQAAMLISIVGFTNIFGRILSGFVTDVFRVRSTVTYTGALFLASAANFLIPWCDSFAPLAACCGVFGLCMATAVSMRTIVLADHLGIDKLTRAFGTVAFFQGIAFMTNAPFAGFLYEKFNSYLMPFTFAGIMYLLSALCCLAVHCLSRCSHGSRDDGVSILIESATNSSQSSSSSSSSGMKHTEI